MFFAYVAQKQRNFLRRKSLNVNVFYASFLFISRVEFNTWAPDIWSADST